MAALASQASTIFGAQLTKVTGSQSRINMRRTVAKGPDSIWFVLQYIFANLMPTLILIFHIGMELTAPSTSALSPVMLPHT